MSAARIAAFNALLSSVGADPHFADMEARKTVHDCALKYARECGYAPPGTERRETTGERAAVAGDGPTVFPPFGRSKGQPIKGAAIDTLRFYEKCARQNLDDPSKAKWHHKEQKLLEAVRAELRRQGEAADHE